jgi:hypothetical protein
MMDPWAKAAECTRALEFATDPTRRIVLSYLREFWIALANQQSMGMTDDEGLAESASGIHADLTASVH